MARSHFDPNQARDRRGRWTKAGAISALAAKIKTLKNGDSINVGSKDDGVEVTKRKGGLVVKDKDGLAGKPLATTQVQTAASQALSASAASNKKGSLGGGKRKRIEDLEGTKVLDKQVTNELKSGAKKPVSEMNPEEKLEARRAAKRERARKRREAKKANLSDLKAQTGAAIGGKGGKERGVSRRVQAVRDKVSKSNVHLTKGELSALAQMEKTGKTEVELYTAGGRSTKKYKLDAIEHKISQPGATKNARRGAYLGQKEEPVRIPAETAKLPRGVTVSPDRKTVKVGGETYKLVRYGKPGSNSEHFQWQKADGTPLHRNHSDALHTLASVGYKGKYKTLLTQDPKDALKELKGPGKGERAPSFDNRGRKREKGMGGNVRRDRPVTKFTGVPLSKLPRGAGLQPADMTRSNLEYLSKQNGDPRQGAAKRALERMDKPARDGSQKKWAEGVKNAPPMPQPAKGESQSDYLERLRRMREQNGMPVGPNAPAWTGDAINAWKRKNGGSGGAPRTIASELSSSMLKMRSGSSLQIDPSTFVKKDGDRWEVLVDGKLVGWVEKDGNKYLARKRYGTASYGLTNPYNAATRLSR